jgi:hypothetical protein
MKKPTYLLCAVAMLATAVLRAADMESSFRDPRPENGARVLPATNERSDITYLVRIDTLAEGSMEIPAGKLLSACISRPDGYGVKVMTDEFRAGSRATLPRGKWRVQLFMAVREPTGGTETMREWSEDFNEQYHSRYKTRPDALYPSLFEESGAGAVRVRMFSLRDSLLAGGGDDLKRYADTPVCNYPDTFRDGVERIGIPASAARNFGKERAVCVIDETDPEMSYRKAMDAYSRGTDSLKFKAVPDDFAEWSARCEVLLGGGRHVAQTGILYPIADMQSRFFFTDPLREVKRHRLDELMKTMTTGVRRDFTLVHPEATDRDFMRTDDGEEFRVMVVPGCRTIHTSYLEELAGFITRGGKVLFTGCLPELSADGNTDNRVAQLMRRIMASGSGQLIEWPDRDNLSAFFERHITNPDITVEIVYSTYKMGVPVRDARDETFRDHAYACNYVHKTKEGRDLYFLANPTDCRISAELTFADTRAPQLWDPHTGRITPLRSEIRLGRAVVQLDLEPLRSCFVVFGE